MPKTLTITHARKTFGRLLDEVHNGDHCIIERAGKPMAAVVPVEQYEQWLRERHHSPSDP